MKLRTLLLLLLPLFFASPVIQSCDAQVEVFGGRNITTPDYAGMTNVLFHHRKGGLVTNTSNAAGTVDGSGNITTITSMSPHATGVSFNNNGTAPTLVNDAIVFGGSGTMRDPGSTSTWNPLHYNATLANMEWYFDTVVQFGTSSNPNAIYGLFGDYGGASTTKGAGFHFDGRSASSLYNSATLAIVRGTSNTFILQAFNNGIIQPGQPVHIHGEVDKGNNQDTQVRLWINGKEVTHNVRFDSTVPVTTPTYAMEIGGIGNGIAPATMTLYDITIGTGVWTQQFRERFTSAIMRKYAIAVDYTVDDITLRSHFLPLIKEYDDTQYYLPVSASQDPTDLNTIAFAAHNSTNHVYEATGTIATWKSTDRGNTIGAKVTAINPSGAASPYGVTICYDATGLLHMVYDQHTAADNTSTNTLWYVTSSDDGATWGTPTDITSSLPSDGLASWRVDNKMILVNGNELLTTLYKVTNEGDATNSANYVLHITSLSGTPSFSTTTVRSSSSTYINEATIWTTSGTGSSINVFVAARNESTFEWTLYKSTNTASTFSSLGDLNFSESLTRPAPLYAVEFLSGSTKVIGVIMCDRDRDLAKIIYGTASNIDASGVSGFNLATKHVIAQGYSNRHYHYGAVINPYNDFRAIAFYPFDEFPASGPGTANTIQLFYLPTKNYPSVKTLLGL